MNKYNGVLNINQPTLIENIMFTERWMQKNKHVFPFQIENINLPKP